MKYKSYLIIVHQIELLPKAQDAVVVCMKSNIKECIHGKINPCTELKWRLQSTGQEIATSVFIGTR